MRLIISFILFFILTKAFAQQNKVLTEQEYLILQSKIRLNFNASTDSAFIYAYQMAKSQNYKHLVFANGALSYLFQIQGKEKESKEKYALTLSYLKKIPDSKDKIQLSSYIYNFAGLTERKRNNFSAALENFQKAIKLSIQIDDIIQIVKIKANIALIHEAVGNYQLAIKNLKQLNKFVAENRNQYTEDDFSNRMSNINLGIGTSYEGYYMKNHSKMYLLDSAQYYYKKCIGYSENFADNKVNSKLSLGNIYNWKHDFKNAEKTYHEVVVLAQQNDFKDLLCIAVYNLADVNYTLKNYDKALIYYQKCDSIACLTASNNLDYLKSNYYQAKIYTILNMPELAYKHSQIYLDKYDKFETKLNNETVEVNYKQGIDDLTTEMVSIEKKAK
jgi:tetratricopeptide (TPR) repeat protein